MKRQKKTGRVAVPLALVIGMVFAIVVLTVTLWSVKRRQDTHLQVKQPGDLRALLPSIAGLTQGVIEPGNRVTVLQNGAFFDALLEDIDRAQVSIHIESYVWWTGDICRKVAAALAKKARQGVEVRLLLDAAGSAKMDDRLYTMMQNAGCRVAKFHPIRISNLGRLNNRDHRKIAVIDGRAGFVGGHGFAEEWTGNAQDRNHWRDTFVRIEGPLVNRLQAAFSENWIEETGEVPAGERYFPRPVHAGTIPGHAAYSSPSGSVSSVQLLYHLAISAAKEEILIQNPYFLPDKDGLKALADAVARGVDVRVMLPSASVTDSPIVQHASHHRFGNMLESGVKIYEYQRTLLHQKVMIVDGIWVAVGSTNFDDRSFELNDEISVGFLDTNLAGEFRAAFQDDLRWCSEVQLAQWRTRPLREKAIDSLAFLANEQL